MFCNFNNYNEFHNSEGGNHKMIEYIDYTTMKDFYTISELCDMFGKTKGELKALSEMLGVEATWNRDNQPGFYKSAVRLMHNYLYHEQRALQMSQDPWA